MFYILLIINEIYSYYQSKKCLYNIFNYHKIFTLIIGI